jgi:hypothetical protein
MTTTPTESPAALYAEYSSGRAITEGLADLLDRDGVAHNRRILTADEFAVAAAYANTLPSTPANNVWD